LPRSSPAVRFHQSIILTNELLKLQALWGLEFIEASDDGLLDLLGKYIQKLLVDTLEKL
jgi:hypothetical protein